MFKRHILISISAVLLALATRAPAGTFSTDFNSGLPPGTSAQGTVNNVARTDLIEATGGVTNSGVLKITKAANGEAGSFVIDDLDAGAPVYGFDLTAKVRVGGGTSTPADGFSINFDPTATPTTTTGEEGTSGGITFAFDIFDNAPPASNENVPAPSIDLKVLGATVATHKMSIADFDTGTNFVDLHIQVAADGGVSLAYKGAIIFTNVYFAAYQPLSGASFVIGGRTGGLNENQFFDNLNITTYTTAKIGFTRQLHSESVLVGHDVDLVVAANNADSATYQYFKNGLPVSGATNSSLTITNVTTANSGDKYKVVVTGPNNTLTSDEITITTVDIPEPISPQISFDFNDGAIPAGTILSSSDATIGGYITPTGGVGDSGVLHLADAVNSANGTFVIDDVSGGAPVYGFTARFDVLVGGGTVPPADGFSFNFANDIPDAPTGNLEDGVGTGLTVGFDLYDNVGNENPPAPSIDVRYKGAVIASAQVPYTQLETGTNFDEVLIHLDTDGTLDVAYKGVVIFNNLVIPQFSSISTGRFALVGRTGGLNDNIWVDNLQIANALTPGAIRITTPPTAQTVLVGKTATFTVSVNDTNGTTFQYFKNGTPISGATSISFTTPVTTAGDTGTKYKVAVTKNGVTQTSDEVALTTVSLAPPTTPTVSFNFNDGTTPTNTVIAGTLNGAVDTTSSGYISATGGVGDSGVVHLVDAVNSAAGAFVVQPLLGGAEVSSFTAAFDVLVGGGSVPPADGFSFNFAPNLPDTAGTSQDGTGNGITIGFDIYDNGGETPPAPSIDVRYKGAVVASVQLPYTQIETGTNFVTVLVRVSTDGKLDLAYGDRVVFNGLQLPNYSFIVNGKFGWYAVTGGLNENIWLDNVSLGLTKSTVLRFATEPADILVLPGQTATFNASVTDPTGVTYQFLKNGSPISGATSNSFTTAALTAADSGATYSVKATSSGGTTLTSRAAVVTVVNPITVSNPQVTFNFDDGTDAPAGTILNGGAGGGTITPTGGVNDSGVLHLTDAANGEAGTFIISDFNNGAPVSAFTAHLQVLVGGGSTPPADGFSFVWVNDLQSAVTFGEDGSGTGLIISFDIFDNAPPTEIPPAPSIDVRYNGTLVATVQMPYQQIETGSTFADLFIRVESDGTLDLQYKGNVIFNNVQLPGYAPLSGADFAIGARTGGFNENQWVDNVEIATTSAVTGPSISGITLQNGKVVVQWSATAATLQSAPSVLGPWTDVTGATSPYQTTPSLDMQFYRLKQ